ncbi:MAG TPA: Gmad2 immunoglobulin-like domain-containing protein [Symbiobacteriaceae bacterium]|nr:Gmad2 immunoglobulin-like domain-containing protein [Symbiobacteriaceae bacterium]
MRKRNGRLIGAGVAVIILIALIGARYYMTRARTPNPTTGPTTPDVTFFTAIDLNSAPTAVQEAAEKLKTSRVGYPIVTSDKTYLVISTGSVAERVKYDSAVGHPSLIDPDLATIELVSNPAGSNLLVGTTPLTTAVEYQFDVDGKPAGIPTLHNPHNLALTYLDAKTRFSLLAPAANQMVQNGQVHIEGYAQVFEARFTAKVITADGRVLGQASVASAAGAPSWGSFVADVTFDTKNLPETGFLVLEEGMNGAVLKVPVRFRPPAQMG